MDFDEYQKEAGKTAVYKDRGSNITYPTLGLAGEAGEVAEKIKKIYRDKGGHVSDEDRQAIKKELGDVLWYMAELATNIDVSLQDVAETNVAKLRARMEKNMIHGYGDNRENE